MCASLCSSDRGGGQGLVLAEHGDLPALTYLAGAGLRMWHNAHGHWTLDYAAPPSIPPSPGRTQRKPRLDVPVSAEFCERAWTR